MRFFYAAFMFVSAILAFYQSLQAFFNKNKKEKVNKIFAATALASGLWSIGYAGMLATNQEFYFIIFRGFGIFGLLFFLITCQVLLSVIAEYKVGLHSFLTLEAIVGVFVFMAISRPDSIHMVHTDKGIVTNFVNPTLSIVYTLYTVAVAVCFTVIIISILRSKKKKRIREFGKRLFIVEIIILMGMVVDTILPAFGVNFNIPASTMIQFIGLEIVYYAVAVINRNRISIQNMTGYIYNSMKMPILVFDTENRLKLYNNVAKKLFELDASKNTASYDFWQEELKLHAPVRAEDSYETVIIDCFYMKKNMNCKIFVDFIHDDYDDYLGYIVSVNDITEIVNNLNEMEQMKNEAMNANKAKSLFLANMSHEIRTPMNSILGFSEIALKDEIPAKTREYFEDIHSSASVLLATINDILDISKIESGKMELVCDEYYPSRVIKDVELIVGMQASKKNLDFKVELAPDFPGKLYGDQTKVREILINLLNNSVKYTKEGSILLKADFRATGKDSGVATFVVKDTGIGIKENEIDGLFNSFQRADLEANRNTEGTGLGLSITKGFVELMGGEIKVKSTYGEGSEFMVTIVQKVIDAAPVEKADKGAANEKQQLKFKELNVLAVDDNMINLKVISKIIERYGIVIDNASSGPESIEMCKNKDYDLVLMDQMMPEMDGIEAMKHIRELGGGYEAGGKNKILALTANAIVGTKEMLVKEGFDEYLWKPIDIKILEQVLTGILPEDKYYYE